MTSKALQDVTAERQRTTAKLQTDEELAAIEKRQESSVHQNTVDSEGCPVDDWLIELLTDYNEMRQDREALLSHIRALPGELDKVEICIANADHYYSIYKEAGNSIFICNEEGEGMGIGFDMLDKFFRENF